MQGTHRIAYTSLLLLLVLALVVALATDRLALHLPITDSRGASLPPILLSFLRLPLLFIC